MQNEIFVILVTTACSLTSKTYRTDTAVTFSRVSDLVTNYYSYSLSNVQFRIRFLCLKTIEPSAPTQTCSTCNAVYHPSHITSWVITTERPKCPNCLTDMGERNVKTIHIFLDIEFSLA